MAKKRNYWVVGAMWGGTDDVLGKFIRRGYWYCWDTKETPSDSDEKKGNSVSAQRERFRQIVRGDRIAVKKMLGRGSTKMEVRAIGIVRDVDLDEWRVYVKWLTTKSFSRKVALHGCTASVHGPFDGNDDWAHEVFCI